MKDDESINKGSINMPYFRLQDLVARLSGVNFQATVRVLNALHVACLYLEDASETEAAVDFSALQNLLKASCFDGAGHFTGFRSLPSEAAAEGCYAISLAVCRHYPIDTRLIKPHSPIDRQAIEQFARADEAA